MLYRSDVHRRIVALEWANVRVSGWWIEAGVSLVRKARPVLMVLAPLVGFWFVRKATGRSAGGPSRLWERLAVGLTIFQRARGLWEQFAKKKPPE